MPDKNWLVPVCLERDYWSADLYFAGFETAAEVKRAAQANLAGLAAYVMSARAFIIGDPKELP